MSDRHIYLGDVDCITPNYNAPTDLASTLTSLMKGYLPESTPLRQGGAKSLSYRSMTWHDLMREKYLVGLGIPAKRRILSRTRRPRSQENPTQTCQTIRYSPLAGMRNVYSSSEATAKHGTQPSHGNWKH